MLSIPSDIWQDMIEHARDLDPHECCGILAGTDEHVTMQYRITNILARMHDEADLAHFDQAKLSDLKNLTPEERADVAFQMDAQEMSRAQKDIRQKGITLKAFYHSHTFSPARPYSPILQSPWNSKTTANDSTFLNPTTSSSLSKIKNVPSSAPIGFESLKPRKFPSGAVHCRFELTTFLDIPSPSCHNAETLFFPLPRSVTMLSSRLSVLMLSLLVPLSASMTTPSLAFTDEPGKEGSFYSPVIRVVPERGFILINSGSGILWLKASEAAMPHISKLPVGGLLDVVVEFQGKPNPPIIKSWKLASGDSACRVFDGTQCVGKEKKGESVTE